MDIADEEKKKKPTSEAVSSEELKVLKKKNKFYLPVLNLNQADMWESLPVSQRKHFTDEQATKTCLSECGGFPGVKSGCCQLDPDDLEHVLGPVDETWIKKMIHWYKKKGQTVTRHDLVIDQEEGELIGKTFFNGHKVFSQPDSYPMLRIQVSGNRFTCKFLNNETGKCNIYAQRSDMCARYLCQYVVHNFLVHPPGQPNTWKKVK